MRRAQSRSRALLIFLAGAVAGGALVWSWQNAPARVNAQPDDDCGDPSVEARSDEARMPPPPPVVEPPKPAVPELPLPPPVTDAVPDLRARRLTLPVKGVASTDLYGSFDEERSGGRKHEAMDILAPRNTPVLAVEDGAIARLFESKAGGLTIYQFDPSATYAYYYAHLERYAGKLTDGDRVRRGQVIGYVGTSGNAPPGTPHLHFAIFKLNDKKQWWKGTAIDPFHVLR
jgi:murein DD-endopeptidase MepM/ murein hydrolase activator NlpD